MRGLINRSCRPRESLLLAAEKRMAVALADANTARAKGDTAGYAKHLARLHALVEQATEILGEGVS